MTSTSSPSYLKKFDEDFDISFQQQPKLDPFLYATDAVKQEIQYLNNTRVLSQIFSAAITAVAIAPFQTICTSLQLSVMPHKNMYDKQLKQNPDLSPNSKQIKKINTNLTIQEKRRMELQIRAAQKQPYTAPVYSRYTQAIRGLASQGWRAFFKGTSFRVGNSVSHLTPLYFLTNSVCSDQAINNPLYPVFVNLKLFVSKCIIDIATNVFHVGENRMILQNNIKQFRSYKNTLQFLKKVSIRGQLWKGSSYHLINNLIESFLRLPLYSKLISRLGKSQDHRVESLFAIMYYIGEVIIYPFNTAFKRVVCQCTQTPGMIPLRYKSTGHAFKVIFFEEGIKGWYRGFALYHLVMLIRLGLIGSVFVKDQYYYQAE